MANNYLLGIQLTAAKSKIQFSHQGSCILDRINCFDLAEVENANLSQINVMEVSSFCGPNGLIWGYDVFPCKKEILNFRIQNKNIPIYNLNSLSYAFQNLLGTIEKPRFPFLPGSHLPCASKNIIAKGECIIYTAEGLGIPEDRQRQACLLMEDVGKIPLNIFSVEEYKKEILKKVIKSIITIGMNQRINFKEIFVGIKVIKVERGEIGCAMAVSPYFHLAKNAIPQYQDNLSLNIYEWENEVKNNFLYKNGSF